MPTYHLQTPLDKATLASLHSGDVVFLSGVIYSARDSAHKRMMEDYDKGLPLPINPEGAVIYYVGPSPAPPGRPIGAAGPTTSGRMDMYTPFLYDLGLAATIGKGKRSQAVRDAMQHNTAVYFGATGGAGALLSRCILAAEIIAYEEMGPEAMRKLTIKDFPLLVINDAHGKDLYAVPQPGA